MTRVLVVEDHADQLRVRGQLLVRRGFAVSTAASAADAVRLLGENPPDVLLMDLRLPSLGEGLELIRAAAAQPSPPRIVVLSGWPDELFEKPEARHVARVLMKPARTAALLEALRLPG